MKTIDLNDSNQEIAEKLVHRVFASANPQATAINLIRSMIDHPWLDAEMHDDANSCCCRQPRTSSRRRVFCLALVLAFAIQFRSHQCDLRFGSRRRVGALSGTS